MSNAFSAPPVLSICIPTYNRPREFQRLAKCLSLQGARVDIEIVVRDDSPNEETHRVVQEVLLPIGVAVKYFHGERIGLDAANIFLIENATGEFVWWFSDDDEMRPGAVDHVLDLINSDDDLRYIWANFDFEQDGRSVVHPVCKYFASGDDVITALGVNIGLVSTHIFHRKTALEAAGLARENCLGFGFAGLIPVFHVITSPGRYYLLGKPYILCNPTKTEEIISLTNRNGAIDNRGFDVYGVHFYRVVKLFEDKFSHWGVRKLLSTNFGFLWRGMLVGWVGGWDTPQGKRLRMLKLYWSYPECWIALPLFCMPRPVVKRFYQGYRLFFSHRRFVFQSRLQKWLEK